MDVFYYIAIDEIGSGVSADFFANTGKIFGRDTEFVGIEGDLPLLSTILVHELRKTVEQLHLPGGVLEDPGLFASKALHLVVNLQQDILQTVLDDRVAE